MYNTIRNTFMGELGELWGLKSLVHLNFERTNFVLGCENWNRYDY